MELPIVSDSFILQWLNLGFKIKFRTHSVARMQNIYLADAHGDITGTD